jgi:hypothetical protein
MQPATPSNGTHAAFHFPHLEDATLDDPGVERLFEAVSLAAKLLDVVMRDGLWTAVEEGDASDDAWDRLELARDALRRGAFVQLRYLFDGSEWWDTLVPLMDGRVRLLRVDRGALAAKHWS